MLSRNEFERSRHSYLQGGALEPTLVEPLLKPNVVQYTRTVSKASNLKSLPNYRRQARGRIIQGITEKMYQLIKKFA